MADLRWTEAQLEAISERRAELLVSAAAGSGKTAVLVERVLRLALGGKGLEPVPLDNMLVVTFTRAAASELLGRLHQALLASRSSPEFAGDYSRLANVRHQLTALPRAQISTIHSFCAEVIRRQGHLAGLELGPQLDEQEAALLRHELATELLDERLGDSAEVRELALMWGGQDGVGPEDLSQVMYGRGLREPMLKLHDLYCSLVDPLEWEQQHVRLAPLSTDGPDPTDPAVASFEVELLDWREHARRVHEQAAKRLGGLSPEPAYLVLSARRCEAAAGLNLENGWQHAADLLRSLKAKQDDIKWKPTLLTCHRRDIEDEQTKVWLEALHRPLADSANDLLAELSRPWAEVAARENTARAGLALLWNLMLEFDGRYGAYKRGRNLTDFNDLERHALRILALHEDGRIMLDDAGRPRPSSAALEYRSRFEAVLVDEYQDVNSLQEAIIGLVTRDADESVGRPRFSVGDIKQSIYDFRGAEPQLFKALGGRLDELPAHTGRVVRLSENFRSREAVIAAVNEVFDGVMTDELGGEDYTQNRLAPGCDYAQLFSDRGAEPESDAKPRLHIVELTDDAGGAEAGEDAAPDDEATMLKSEQVYHRVADVLREIHTGGQPVFDKAAGAVRRVAWRDMAVLLRSARGRMETLRAVLDDAGIPYYAPARSGFYERPEVSDALSLLRVIDNPRQDIALAAALSGPACGLDPAQLLELSRTKLEAPGGCLWDKAASYLEAGEPAELRDALAAFAEQLGRWCRLSRLEPLPVLLWDVYDRAGLLAAAAALPGGEQRLANLYQLHELARQFSAFERQGLARFMRYLEHSRRARGDLGEAPLAGEGQDVVRVMTVHQAKGLEFPVVVIPDVDKGFNLADLSGDVLSHKDAGLGGRFVDMRAEPPERGATLGLRRLKRVKRVDLLSQELRVMYVALTRARERLELVAAVDPAGSRDAEPKQPTEAGCWLDWIGCSLGAGIEAALAGEDREWEGEHWAVLARPPEHAAAETPAAMAVLGDQELAAIGARLAAKYPHPGATVTPAKLTVTELAKQPELADAEDQPAAVVDAATALGGVPALYGRGSDGSPMVRGTALHLLLAAIDPRQAAGEPALRTALDALVGRGLVDADLAAALDLAKLAAALELLAPHLAAAGMELHRELPFAMLVPSVDPALAAVAGSISGGTSAARDEVYVQGVIDVLAVTAESALIVDYKSDRGAGADELTGRYRLQLEWYCRAVAAMLPGRQVSWALLGLDQPVLAGPYRFSPAVTGTD